MENDNRIPLDHFADFSRCTLYRDPAHPELGTTASLRYDAAMEAMAQTLAARRQARKDGNVPEGTAPFKDQIAIKGRAPHAPYGGASFIYAMETGGAIGDSIVRWYVRLPHGISFVRDNTVAPILRAVAGEAA